MSHLKILEPDAAPESVQAVYSDFRTRMAFPEAPNFIKVQGHSSAVVQGSWDLVRNVLVMGKISRYIKEMLFVAISKERGCGYCEAAHIACCRMLGVDQALLDSLVYDIPRMTDHKLRDMLMFGLKCAMHPRTIGEPDIRALRGHGLDDGEILELIAMSGLAVYANIMADATAVPADAMFAECSAKGSRTPAGL
jgi:uncharacterized peroxidase-related enzyme